METIYTIWMSLKLAALTMLVQLCVNIFGTPCIICLFVCLHARSVRHVVFELVFIHHANRHFLYHPKKHFCIIESERVIVANTAVHVLCK